MEVAPDKVMQIIAENEAARMVTAMEDRINERIDTLGKSLEEKIDTLGADIRSGYVSCSDFDQFHKESHERLSNGKINRVYLIAGIIGVLILLGGFVLQLFSYAELHSQLIHTAATTVAK